MFVISILNHVHAPTRMKPIETLVPVDGDARRPPSHRVHGTYEERASLFRLANEVVVAMRELHPELADELYLIDSIPMEFSWEHRQQRIVCDLRMDRRTGLPFKIIVDRNMAFQFPMAAMVALHQHFVSILLGPEAPIEQRHMYERRLTTYFQNQVRDDPVLRH